MDCDFRSFCKAEKSGEPTFRAVSKSQIKLAFWFNPSWKLESLVYFNLVRKADWAAVAELAGWVERVFDYSVLASVDSARIVLAFDFA